MRRTLAVLIAAIGLVLSCTESGPVPVPAAATAPLPHNAAKSRPFLPIMAYYYQWFEPSSWDRAKIDYPLLGRYSSDDAEVMRQHVRMAKAAGINGFLVSWKSTPTNDRRLHQLVDVARAENFRLGVVYQGLDFDRRPQPIDRVAADLRFFRDTFAPDPVFHLLDRPLVMWSGTWAFSRDEIAAAVAPVRADLRVLASEKDVDGYLRIADVVEGNAYYWSSVDPALYQGFGRRLQEMGTAVHDQGGLWLAPFAPGFDARLVGGTREVDRRDGATLTDEYNAAVRSSPDVLGLISWNEFSENTHVEPSQKHGNRYLDVLDELLESPAEAAGELAQDSSAEEGASSSAPDGMTVLIAILGVLALLGAGIGVRQAVRRRAGRSTPVAGSTPAPLAEARPSEHETAGTERQKPARTESLQPGDAAVGSAEAQPDGSIKTEQVTVRATINPAGPARHARSVTRAKRTARSLVALVVVLLGVGALLAMRSQLAPGPQSAEPAAAPAGAQTKYYQGPKPVRDPDRVVVASAGDIACAADKEGVGSEEKNSPIACVMQQTADLVGTINPDAVLTLGDLQYPNGSLERFQAGYDRSWGAYKKITYPVPGNHEYGNRDANGYFSYFGAAAGSPEAGYYSYDLGGWHVIALNSECAHVGGCGVGSDQERWLQADLAAHPSSCSLAYWHQPRYSSGHHGDNTAYAPFWADLQAAGVELVLTGHDHDYERFAPLGPNSELDPSGMREFVVGTGGDSFYALHQPPPAREVAISQQAGVLELGLRPNGYDWNFRLPGSPGNAQAADAGSASCHETPPTSNG